MSLKTILQDVLKFLHLIKAEGEVALHAANDFVSKVLAFEQTPTGQEIEAIIEGVMPAGLKAGFILWLPTVFKALRWATSEDDKTDEEVIADGLGYLKSLTGDVKALQAGTLSAATSKWVSDNTEGGLTIQQTMTANQAVHDPALGTRV